MAEKWRKLESLFAELAKQNPGIETIVDGLERHARHLLKAEHIETAKKLFFLNDPPGDASPLICGCYQILRNIHCLRQAIALNDVRSAAYHAFYIGRERQRIIATRERSPRRCRGRIR